MNLDRFQGATPEGLSLIEEREIRNEFGEGPYYWDKYGKEIISEKILDMLVEMEELAKDEEESEQTGYMTKEEYIKSLEVISIEEVARRTA